jgi:hypothetical protein
MASDIACYLKREMQGPDMLVESIATYASAIDSSISFQKGHTKDASGKKELFCVTPKMLLVSVPQLKFLSRIQDHHI